MYRRRPSSAVLAVVVPAVLLLVVSGCVDMEVENPGAPDAALSEPAAVTALLDGAFHDWTLRPYGTDPGMSLAVGAEMFTSPWGNWWMPLLWAYPRRAWPNDLGTQGAHGAAWDGLYNGLRAAGDVMWALEREVVEFGPDDPDRAAVHAFARLIQGLNLAWIALYFDQGFILDETVDVERDGLEPVPYGEVFEVGMGHLADALEVSRENTFTVPEEWFNGLTVTNEDLERWIHSFKAQFLSQVARSPGERGQVDWARVLEHVEQGIVEDAYLPGDDEGGWWHRQIRYGHDPVWGRVDMLVLAPADTTAAWEEWLASWHSDGDGDWWDRAPFVIETSDRRIHAPGEPEEPGTDFAYQRPSILLPNPMATHHRGSHYRAERYDDWLDLDSPWPMLTLREMDFLRAEALLRLDRQGEAAEIINRTRVERGGWEPVGADDPDLMEFLIYEKRIETYALNGPGAFFDARGWGLLGAGTPVHFPIPGRELEDLGMDAYTFGGDQPGAAPPAIIAPRAY